MKTIFSTVAEILDVPQPDNFKHPFLTMAKFIFADDKGNSRNQGIKLDDFDEVIKTSIDMPVKMNFSSDGVGGHFGSYVIGHITKMTKEVAEDGSNVLMAWAALYNDEFPEEIKFLKEAYASGNPPGISYEISYSSPIIEGGIEWLKNIFTTAATFVKHPAYGKRTALLALASAKDDAEFMDRMKAIVAQAGDNLSEESDDEGGNIVDEKELEKAREELARLQAEAETRTAEIERLREEVNTRDGQISTLTSEIESLKRDKILDERVRRYVEAGLSLEAEAEKADKTKEFLLSLSEDAFEVYISQITELSTKKRTEASDDEKLPKLDGNITDTISFSFRD